MNRRRAALITTTVILTAASLSAASGSAHADERVCRGSLGAIMVDNLRVPEQATCTLNGTLVEGTIKVESGATPSANSARDREHPGRRPSQGAAFDPLTTTFVCGFG